MAVGFFGDYDTTETAVIPFNTFSSDDPSASVTITNLAAADIHIHKDGGTTQRSSASGVTVSIDFDTITGNHIVSIDLSDNTDAGFYAVGSRYQVRMEGTTVDGGTINAWIGAFSIGCTLRPTTNGRTLDVTATGAAGIDWGNVENPTTAVDLSATDIQLADTVTTLTGHTAQTGDSFARIGVAGAGLTNINLPNQTMDIVGNITGNLSGSVGSVTGAVGSVTGAVGSVTGNVGGNVTGSVGSVTGHTNQTGDTYALANGAAGFVAIDTVVDAILALLDDARGEPGQGAPPVNPDAVTKIDYIYKFLRNKTEQTSTTLSIYDDAGTTVDQKSTVSDNGTTATRGEIVSGP